MSTLVSKRLTLYGSRRLGRQDRDDEKRQWLSIAIQIVRGNGLSRRPKRNLQRMDLRARELTQSPVERTSMIALANLYLVRSPICGLSQILLIDENSSRAIFQFWAPQLEC